MMKHGIDFNSPTDESGLDDALGSDDVAGLSACDLSDHLHDDRQ
jgi:hypothetical protein